MEWMSILKRFDLINLLAIGLVWWNINGKINTMYEQINVRLVEVEKRLTIIETVMLCNHLVPSHVAKGVAE